MTPTAAHADLPAADPALLAPADAEARLQRVEAFGDEISAAIGSLVDAVLELKAGQQQAPALAVLPTGLAEAIGEVAGLKAKVKELEQQLTLERSSRDFAEVSRMHPKARRVVFVGTTFFGDNVKYAWLALRERAAELALDVWWLPHNAEQQRTVEALGGQVFPAAYADWSDAHLHAAFSAAVVVLTDHFLNPNPFAPALLAGARQVQLWHGLSIKEIGFRNLPGGRGLGTHLARVLNTCGKFASFVGTQAANEGDWRRWLAFDRYAPIGYPRNDVLHREPTEADLANVDRHAYGRAVEARAQGKRVFVYAPTFRDGARGRWLLDAGLAAVAEMVAAAGDLLLLNLHPVEAPQAGELMRAMPGVTFVQPRSDIYPLLRQSTALVTDYSSLIFDYLHLDRPILLFRPDHAAYVQRSRKLFDGRLAELPGPVLADAAALAQALAACGRGADRHAEARARLAAATFDTLDGQAADRVAALIADEVARALPAA